MPVQPPTIGQLQEIAGSHGLALGDEDLDSFRGLMVPLLESFTAVEQMVEPAPLAPTYPRTAGYRPDPSDNPWNARYWRCEIQGSPDGPLAGRRVAVKGQHLRGRRPHDERVGHAGGLPPRGRRHRGQAHARRRRHHRRQGDLRGPVFLEVLAGADGLDPRQPSVVPVEPYSAGLDGNLSGLRVGVLAEGFEWGDRSEPAVDEAVRDAALRLEKAGPPTTAASTKPTCW